MEFSFFKRLFKINIPKAGRGESVYYNGNSEPGGQIYLHEYDRKLVYREDIIEGFIFYVPGHAGWECTSLRE